MGVEWVSPTITTAGVVVGGLLVAWWQHGGQLTARRRKLDQELEMLQRVPLDTDEGQEFARYVRGAMTDYIARAGRPSWWRRALINGWILVCPWLIYRVWTNQELQVGLKDVLIEALPIAALFGACFLAGNFLASNYVAEEFRDFKRAFGIGKANDAGDDAAFPEAKPAASAPIEVNESAVPSARSLRDDSGA